MRQQQARKVIRAQLRTGPGPSPTYGRFPDARIFKEHECACLLFKRWNRILIVTIVYERQVFPGRDSPI